MTGGYEAMRTVRTVARRLPGLALARARRWLAIIALGRRAGAPVLALSVFANLMIGLAPIGFIVFTSVMIAHVAALARPGDADGTWRAALASLALGLGSLVVQNALTPAQAALGELVVRRVDGHCAARLMAAALWQAPMALLERRDVLDDLGEARRRLAESAVSPGSAVAGLLALIARYTQLAGCVVLLAVVFSPVAATLIGVTACAARFGNRGSLAWWSVVFQGLAGHRRRLRYVMDTGSDPALANEVRVLGLRDWFTARGRREAGRYHASLWRSRRRIYFGPFLALTAVVLGGATVVLVMLGGAAARGSLSVLDLSLAIQAILIPMRFGVFFPESDLQTQHGATAYEAITTFERRCAVAVSPALGSLAADGLPRTAISLEDVHFAYPGSARPVLAGLDLRLEAGRSTAIVGLNGSGKTTLIKLLARLYEPTSGRIAVDGTDLRELDPEAWQRRLAVIFQDYVRFELDAAANIALGAPGRIGDLAAWRAAAQQAGAAGFIDALPSGPATPLSSRYRGGTDLSGGQWQRIALARALFAVRAGATVLVLDEPTAQLDVRAEAMFFDRFLDLTAGLTTVLISHRFSTVRRADHIAVLGSGRIVEQGDHDRLLRQDGRYAELFRIQANRFRFHGGSAFRDAGAS